MIKSDFKELKKKILIDGVKNEIENSLIEVSKIVLEIMENKIISTIDANCFRENITTMENLLIKANDLFIEMAKICNGKE